VTTYEITVSTEDGEFPTVTGIRRLGCVRGPLRRFGRWLQSLHTKEQPGLKGPLKDIVDLRTIDIVMDVPSEKLREDILQKMAGINAPHDVRLVFCIPTERHERTGSVEV
jgi:hypothetical protein